MKENNARTHLSHGHFGCPDGIQQLLLEQFPDGATHDEIRDFLATLSSQDTYAETLTVLKVSQ